MTNFIKNLKQKVEEMTPDKRKHLIHERSILGDKTNLLDTLKRPANFILSEFDTTTSKKLHINNGNSCPEPLYLKSIE